MIESLVEFDLITWKFSFEDGIFFLKKGIRSDS